jgi:chromosome segregation ATPase
MPAIRKDELEKRDQEIQRLRARIDELELGCGPVPEPKPTEPEVDTTPMTSETLFALAKKMNEALLDAAHMLKGFEQSHEELWDKIREKDQGIAELEEQFSAVQTTPQQLEEITPTLGNGDKRMMTTPELKEIRDQIKRGELSKTQINKVFGRIKGEMMMGLVYYQSRQIVLEQMEQKDQRIAELETRIEGLQDELDNAVIDEEHPAFVDFKEQLLADRDQYIEELKKTLKESQHRNKQLQGYITRLERVVKEAGLQLPNRVPDKQEVAEAVKTTMGEGEELVTQTVNGTAAANEFLNTVLGDMGMHKMPEPRTSNGHATGVKEWVKGTPLDCPDLAPVSGGSGTPEPVSEETTAENVQTCERCTTLEAQVKELTAKNHQALNTVKAIAATCEENRVDTEALRHENALLQAKVAPLQAVIDAYPKSPKHTLVKQNIDLQAEKVVALQEVARLTDRGEELEGSLCAKDDRIEMLEALLTQHGIEVPGA